MYGPLLMLIICAPVLAILIICAIVPYRISDKYDKKCEYYDDVHTGMNDFHNARWEIKMLQTQGRDEELAQLQKNYKISKFWYNVWKNTEILLDVLIVLFGIAVFVFGIWSVAEPLQVSREMIYWEEFVPMAQDTLNSADDYERVAIADKVIEYNTWLVEAKTSQRMWGNWSAYYNVDLTNLPVLTLGEQQCSPFFIFKHKIDFCRNL